MYQIKSDAEGVATILKIVIMIFIFCRGALVEEYQATWALENLGFSNVTITKHAWFMVGIRGCDATDAAMFKATAKNPVGRTVNVAVCVGWPFKGATVRSN